MDKELNLCAKNYVPQTKTSVECSFYSHRPYSPSTTGLGILDPTVLRRHPSFSFVSILVARPKSPKQGEYEHKETRVQISDMNQKVTAHIHIYL